MSMDEQIWGKLPSELLDRIVVFLPLTALTRFKVTSKKYNGWIYSTEFFNLCAQLGPLQQSQVWLVFKDKHHVDREPICTFKISTGLTILQGYAPEEMLPYFGPMWEVHPKAASGCFLYAECVMISPLPGSPQVRCNIVCNYASMACTKLPEFRVNHTWYRPLKQVMLCRANDYTEAYRVVLLLVVKDFLSEQRDLVLHFHVYDSLTQYWKDLPIRRPELPLNVSINFLSSTAVGFHKIFCLLAGPIQDYAADLIAFNIDTGEYEIFSLQILKTISSPRLVASMSKLFLTGWTRQNNLQILEVDFSNSRLIWIAQMPNSLLQGMNRPFFIAGHSDCIIMSNTEHSVIYDLRKRTWRALRFCPRLRGKVFPKFNVFVEADTGVDG